MADSPPRTRARKPPADGPPMSEMPPIGDAPPKITSPGKSLPGLQARLEELLSALALPFAMAGDVHCATIIAQRSPALAEAWANLARENPAVKRVLEKLLQGGAWGGVIVSTLSIAIPIAGHHGLIPAGLPFISPTPPEQNGNGNGAPAEYVAGPDGITDPPN